MGGMSLTPDEVLDTYDRESRSDTGRDWRMRAAADARLPTDFLVRRGIEDTRRARDSDPDHVGVAVFVLQQRVDAATLEVLLGLLEHPDPAAREFAINVLRQFPGLAEPPPPHAQRVVEHLERLVAREQDDEVLAGALSAIAWQRVPGYVDILLRWRDDPRDLVRYKVADNLLMTADEDQPLPEPIVDALLAFATDPDDDIRWSVFFDVADWPRMFADRREAFRAAARAALDDEDHTVGEQAARALAALDAPDPEPCTIHVLLEGEAVDCWRPVHAVLVRPGVHRIMSPPPDPEDEVWEFASGQEVVCEHRRFADGREGLVAVRLAPPGE